MKKTIRVWFTDFWPLFDIENNYFIKLLSENYSIKLDSENPEYLFYSVFGVKHKKYTCIKIFFTGENIRPNYNECDYSFSFDYDSNPKNYRLPLYVIYDDVEKLTFPKPDFDKIYAEKTKFCNFIYSNPNNPVRNHFFKKLSKYKQVDAAGRLYRNTTIRAKNKLDFIKDYKFTIAFENESYPGYQTEKIFEPMLVHSMPVYWGNNLVDKDFNTNSFVSYHDFNNEAEVIDKVIELDRNPELYKEKYLEPYFHNNQVNEFVKKENILRRFDEIFNNEIEPVSLSTPANSKSALIKNIWQTGNEIKFFTDGWVQRFKQFNLKRLKIKILKSIGR